MVLFGPTYPRRTKISHLGGRATYLLGRDIGPAGGQATYLPYPLGTQSMLVLEPHSVLRVHQDCIIYSEWIDCCSGNVNAGGKRQLREKIQSHEQPEEWPRNHGRGARLVMVDG